ncbi:MAG: VWA domain-containing protein [Myxococcales bacterium]|nr:VWA domain-containing protein [Myxococcales bacterium]MCB9520130.1 VWA domain-containing protein [Myxococcales bacterium]MCB9531249.1 VWA domain-containing protein [Myxococcales bacterium]
MRLRHLTSVLATLSLGLAGGCAPERNCDVENTRDFVSMGARGCGNAEGDSGRVGGRSDSGVTTQEDTTSATDAEGEDTATDAPATPEVTGDAPLEISIDTGGGRDVPTGPDARVEDECAEVTTVGDPVYSPIDIIWAVDTSGSMAEEAAIVAEQLNAFVTYIEASGLDVRVVMVGDSSVCVPAPLSGGGCPDTSSERYLHVNATVASTDAFDVLIANWDNYSSFLRREAIKHFVVVSDDESARQFPYFRDALAERGLRYFVFHAIVSLTEGDCFLGICMGCTGPNGSAEAMGRVYMAAANSTGGTQNSICASDWTPTFEGISDNVISGAVLPCQYGIPDLGEGLIIAYDQVDVTINGVLLTRHMDGSGCLTAPGWYYDNNTAPTQVNLCPNVCGSGFDGDEINIEFGCVKG